jgi:hypothetical protein
MDSGEIEKAFGAEQFLFSEHARQQMAIRQLTEDDVLAVLRAPEEILPVREGRVVAQTLLAGYLVRVFVDVDRSPPEVVTAYRTSRIDRYRSQP